MSKSSTAAISMLELAKRNESHAWDRMIEIFGPTVYSWCRCAGVQTTDATDLTQDIFRSAYAGLADFKSDGRAESFRHWLLEIAISKLINFFRFRNQLPASIPSDNLGTLALRLKQQLNHDRHRETLRQVRRAMHTLRDDYQQRTWQAFWRASASTERLSKISTNLGMSAATISASRSQVMRGLRETLVGLVDLPEEL